MYQNLYYIEESRAELILILAGDHVYQMAYDKLVDEHRAHEADVSLPVYTVPTEDASRFGTLILGDDDRVVDFDEKPENPRSNLVSMGIYLFRRDVLIQALITDAEDDSSHHDFGRDILPRIVSDDSMKVYGSRFGGYWRDVGTLDSYFQANMDLLEDVPEMNLYDPDLEIRTRSNPKPPVKIGRHAEISRSLLSVGSIVNGHVEHSVLSPGVYVEEGAVVRDSIIFDDVHIKSGAVIERSVLDKNVIIGKDCNIGFGDDWTVNEERPDIINSGFSIIGKRSELLPGVKVGRNCVIGSGVIASGIDGDYIPSGTTLRAEQHATSFSV